MTRDDIIAMALQAGFEKYEWSSLSGVSELDETLQVNEYPVGETVFEFAALVAAAEREACAKLVEVSDDLADWEIICGSDGRVLLNSMAAAIRARGQE